MRSSSANRFIDALTMEIDRSRRMQRTLRIAAQYRDGVKVSVIADRFECSVHTVLRIARAMDLDKRDKSDDPKRHEKILQMSRRKKRPPASEIAKACGCSVSLVCQVERANGIERYSRDRVGPRAKPTTA